MGSVIRLTVLRRPPYAHHEPHPHRAEQRYDWIGQSAQEFNMVVRPHLGPWQDAGVVERAQQLNQPPLDSQLAISTGGIELKACKMAEDGQGLIARFADRYGQGSQGRVHLSEQSFPVHLAPFEVATLRFTQRKGVWQVSAAPHDQSRQGQPL